MNPAECAQTPMVEALWDGRLGPQEQASIERHLASCAVCTAHQAELARIRGGLRAPLPTLKPLEHQRARAALLRGAVRPQAVRSTRTRMVFALAAAFACIAVATVGFAKAGLGERAAALRAPVSRSGAVAEAVIALHTRALSQTTTLRPSADAVLDRKVVDGTEIVTLSEGALDLTVRPLSATERFLVRTPDAEVEVRGTAFRVEVLAGTIRRVAVTEGTVELRYAGFSAKIPAGGVWVADERQGLAKEPTESKVAPPKTVAARKVALRPPTPEVNEAPPPSEPVAVSEPKTKPDGPSARERASRDFADAMRVMQAGDYAGAAEKLATFSESYSADARSDESDYLRAVALERAGKTQEAAAAARRYLDRRKDGSHRNEAQRIAANAAPK